MAELTVISLLKWSKVFPEWSQKIPLNPFAEDSTEKDPSMLNLIDPIIGDVQELLGAGRWRNGRIPINIRKWSHVVTSCVLRTLREVKSKQIKKKRSSKILLWKSYPIAWRPDRPSQSKKKEKCQGWNCCNGISKCIHRSKECECQADWRMRHSTVYRPRTERKKYSYNERTNEKHLPRKICKKNKH